MWRDAAAEGLAAGADFAGVAAVEFGAATAGFGAVGVGIGAVDGAGSGWDRIVSDRAQAFQHHAYHCYRPPRPPPHHHPRKHLHACVASFPSGVSQHHLSTRHTLPRCQHPMRQKVL